MQLVHVFDAYCGWSYGFSRTLADLADRRPDSPVEVVSGGLFTGARRVPVRQFGDARVSNAKISRLTGVPFGDGYEKLIADGSFVMDSEAAARGMAVLREAAPRRAPGLAAVLQEAFYVCGLSLSDPATYRKIADANGLDADTIAAAFESPGADAAARADFQRARELGVNDFPTLLAVDGDRITVVAVGHATAQQLDRRMGDLARSTP